MLENRGNFSSVLCQRVAAGVQPPSTDYRCALFTAEHFPLSIFGLLFLVTLVFNTSYLPFLFIFSLLRYLLLLSGKKRVSRDPGDTEKLFLS